MDDDIAEGLPRTRTAGGLRRVGGRSCLDFVNTATWSRDVCLRDHLTDFEDLLQWAESCDLGDTSPVRDLIGHLDLSPADLEAELQALRQFRAALRHLFMAEAAACTGSDVERAADRLTFALHSTIGRATLSGRSRPFTWKPPLDPTSWLVGPLALDAVSLLTSPDSPRIRECEGDACGWLFLDRSRSHPRRWCAMEPCGNRLKAGRHAERRRRGRGRLAIEGGAS